MTTRLCWLLWLSVMAHGALAQPYPSKDGKFSVDYISGCAPFDITVTIDPVFTCGGCDVDLDAWESKYTYEATNQSKSFTYTDPGIYWLKVVIATAGVDSIQVTVLDNVLPNFEVYSCGNNEVSVALKDSRYDEYIINYNDASPEVSVGPMGNNRHTFATANTQTVSVRGRNTDAADNCDAASIAITPRTTLPAPTITRLDVMDDSRIRLEYDAEPYIQYRLAIATNNSTTFQQVKTVYNTDADTIAQLRNESNFYCFRLEAYDPCSNTTTRSAVICSPRLDVTPENNTMNVAWATAPSGVSGYTITRQAGDGSTFVANPSASPFDDTGIVCGTDYCYQLTVTWANGSQSFSAEKCATGFSSDTPEPILNVSTLVTDNAVTLQWRHNPAFIPEAFTIEKSLQNRYKELATTAQNAYLDETYRTEDQPCYRISYQDVCGNQSPPGREACPIRLTGSLQDDNAVSLTWTPYNGWTDGVASYLIEKYTADGVLLQTFDAGTATTLVDETSTPEHQALVYQVRALPVGTNIDVSTSNRLPLLKNPNLFHPTAFTPNGDNLNDHFRVYGQYVAGFELMIFNRWGELLFTTTDMEAGWDGTYKGREMPEGTYSFTARITDRTGRTFKRSGSVLLLRKSR